MKLYTEEQVRKAIDEARNYYDGFVSTKEGIINSLISIELPSDEEIEEESEAIYLPYDNDNDLYDIRFAKGAKWMKEQILNQNKQI